MFLDISDETVTCAPGPGVAGPEVVLLAEDDNLLEGTQWDEVGYRVAPFLDEGRWRDFHAGIHEQLRDLLEDAGVETPTDFRPDQYHRYVGDRGDLHLAIARRAAAGFPLERLPIPPGLVQERIEQLCEKPLTLTSPELNRGVFHFRFVRPHHLDNNPLHRDAWLGRLRNAVNIYVPLFGSNERSSLPLVPGSHRWKESEIERTPGGAKIGDAQFTVPGLVAAVRRVEAIRPNPGPNEVLLFSPYLLHGGASNNNDDVTRISLEIRFWRATP